MPTARDSERQQKLYIWIGVIVLALLSAVVVPISLYYSYDHTIDAKQQELERAQHEYNITVWDQFDTPVNFPTHAIYKKGDDYLVEGDIQLGWNKYTVMFYISSIQYEYIVAKYGFTVGDTVPVYFSDYINEPHVSLDEGSVIPIGHVVLYDYESYRKYLQVLTDSAQSSIDRNTNSQDFSLKVSLSVTLTFAVVSVCMGVWLFHNL